MGVRHMQLGAFHRNAFFGRNITRSVDQCRTDPHVPEHIQLCVGGDVLRCFCRFAKRCPSCQSEWNAKLAVLEAEQARGDQQQCEAAASATSSDRVRPCGTCLMASREFIQAVQSAYEQAQATRWTRNGLTAHEDDGCAYQAAPGAECAPSYYACCGWQLELKHST